MGEGAADGTSKGEARVEGDTRELLGLSGLDVLLDSVELDAAGGGGRGLSRHCDVMGWSGDGGGGWYWWWRGVVMGRSMLQNSRYNFYTTISKRPGRLGDYRVLTTPLGRPPQPTPCLADDIFSTLTLD